VTAWYAGQEGTSGPAYQAVTYTELHIPDDVLIQLDSPDDEHRVARNIQRREINKYMENCVKLVTNKKIQIPRLNPVH